MRERERERGTEGEGVGVEGEGGRDGRDGGSERASERVSE